MSTSEAKHGAPGADQTVVFEIRSEDPGAELELLDAASVVVASGVGQVEGTAAPGIYKARARIAALVQEQLVVLQTGSRRVEVAFRPFSLASPAPLSHTVKTHEYHMAPASAGSRRTHVVAGRGSHVFVSVRSFSGKTRGSSANPAALVDAAGEVEAAPPLGVEPARASEAVPGALAAWARPLKCPARGLELVDAQGQRVADFAQVGEGDWEDPARDPIWVCNVEVNPGSYVLRLHTPEGALAQTIVAPEGWQVQVFLLREPGANGAPSSIDLPGSAIFLVREELGFEADSYDLRLIEVARLALTANRSAISRADLGQLLSGKFANPMLGLFGAHVLLMQPQPDLPLLRTVVRNLRGLLGQHPDVEAIAIAIGDEEAAKVSFAVPPMLLRSWSLVVEHSLNTPTAVPRGSLASRVATRLFGAGPWLLWTEPAKRSTDSSLDSAPSDPRVVASRLSKVDREKLSEVSDFEHALLNKLAPKPPPEVVKRAGLAHAMSFGPGARPSPTRLARSLGVPPSAIADAMDDLLERAEEPSD